MKTVRTILATLAAVLLCYSLTAWISVRQDAAFVQRTIFQGFDQTFIIALVMGGAFLLIAIILTVAIASTGGRSRGSCRRGRRGAGGDGISCSQKRFSGEKGTGRFFPPGGPYPAEGLGRFV